jgi:hypothetical protein
MKNLKPVCSNYLPQLMAEVFAVRDEMNDE